MATKTAQKPAFFFDTDQIIAVQQRNVDAFASAGQVMVDGYKAIALRQSEMVQSGLGSLVADGQKMVDGKAGEFKPEEQINRAKSGYEAALANARELTEIAVKAQNEAFNILTKAAMANFDDFKSLAKAA
ncbi:MAG TPA: phasin family protein [Geminicoccaceae bacterium]